MFNNTVYIMPKKFCGGFNFMVFTDDKDPQKFFTKMLQSTKFIALKEKYVALLCELPTLCISHLESLYFQRLLCISFLNWALISMHALLLAV